MPVTCLPKYRVWTGLRRPSWLPQADGSYPTLYADFVNNRCWLGAVGANISDLFSDTRAGTQYVANSSGVLSSFSAGVLPYTDIGIELEESRTNEGLKSNLFSGYNTTVTADYTTSPDGTTTASRLLAGDFLQYHYANLFNSQYQPTLTGTYTLSVFVKAAGRDQIALGFGAVNSSHMQFTFSTETVSNVSAGYTAGFKAYGSGWYRIWLTKTFAADVTYPELWVAPGNTNPSGATWDLYAWGAQIELGSYSTSYIPTDASSATRAINQVTTNSTALSSAAVSIGTGSLKLAFTSNAGAVGVESWIWRRSVDANNYMGLRVTTGNKLEFIVVTGGATVAQFTSTNSIVADTPYKAAIRWSGNDCGAAFTASLETSVFTADSSCTMPTGALTEYWGHNAGSNAINGKITELAEWDVAVNDATLDTLRAA